VVVDDTTVKIEWTAPTNTGGTDVVITEYLIEIQLADGSFESACDGKDNTIIA